MLSPMEQQRQLAQLALQNRPGNPGHTGTPIMNDGLAASEGRALPSQARESVQTQPSWVDYLGGVQRVAQASPHSQNPPPIAGGTKTQNRLEFEEGIRQFNEQMAFNRAVQASNNAARAAAAAAKGKENEDPINVKSAIWEHVRGAVDEIVEGGGSWATINQYLVSNYGDFPKEAPFEDIQKAAFSYYDSKQPVQAWQGVQEDDSRKWWQFWKPPKQEPQVVEDIESLRGAFYGDQFSGF